MIREKQIKSGRLLDIDFYPVWKNGFRIPMRAPKTKPSTAEQEKYNRNQAVKKIVRLINANFDDNDIIMHPTYKTACAPLNEKDARRDIVNYLRRVKTKRASELKKITAQLKALSNAEVFDELREKLELKKKKLSGPFKYIYVIETTVYKSGKYVGRNNYHFHLFITGGIERKVLENMWTGGLRTNADRFQPEKFGPEAIGKYMAKAPNGAKSFVCSKNLDKPQDAPKIKDGRVNARDVERMAKLRIDDRKYWEKKYKGYKFIRCFPRYNEYNGHWYVSVVMYKTNGLETPKWDFDGWADVGW